VIALACSIGGACRWTSQRPQPTVEFSRIPEAAEGGSQRRDTIEGRVRGARPGQQIVLFARSGIWWVQPLVNAPFTTIRPDSTWTSSTHLGTEYAALLVEPGYRPPETTEALPAVGGPIIAVATVKGPASQLRMRMVRFSGYDWEIREVPSDRGGPNLFDPANVWTDDKGFLHLAITRRQDQWTSAEVILTRSLGYGTYSFVVRDTSELDPAAAFSMITWDDRGAEQNHRELGIEISRWGDPSNKNAQFVIQPYYVAANVARFDAPPGTLTHSFRWEPERVSFKTVRGAPTDIVAAKELTSGVPSPGGEAIRINLYVFGYSPLPMQNQAEVVIEKFEYLPR
jgi:hypothetical protein